MSDHPSKRIIHYTYNNNEFIEILESFLLFLNRIYIYILLNTESKYPYYLLSLTNPIHTTLTTLWLLNTELDKNILLILTHY